MLFCLPMGAERKWQARNALCKPPREFNGINVSFRNTGLFTWITEFLGCFAVLVTRFLRLFSSLVVAEYHVYSVSFTRRLDQSRFYGVVLFASDSFFFLIWEYHAGTTLVFHSQRRRPTDSFTKVRVPICSGRPWKCLLKEKVRLMQILYLPLISVLC